MNALALIRAATEPAGANKVTKPGIRAWCLEHGDRPALRFEGTDIEALYDGTRSNPTACTLVVYGYGRGFNAEATTEPAYVNLVWRVQKGNTTLHVDIVRHGGKPYAAEYPRVQRYPIDRVLRGVLVAYLKSPQGQNFLENTIDR